MAARTLHVPDRQEAPAREHVGAAGRAGTSGGLDEVPVDRVADFEKKYLAFCRANHADVLASIRDDKKWTDELKTKCDEMVTAFKAEFLA